MLLIPIACAVLLTEAAYRASQGGGGRWLAFVVGLLAGATPAATYTLVLWRQRRLFLRTEVDVEQSRSRIESISIPAGWILGGLVAFSMATLSDAGRIPVETFLAGALLAFYPGLFANFLRLRREEWS